MRFAAVLPAGGVGSRFGADKPKQFLELKGKPLWRHALEAFLYHPEITQVVLVCHPLWIAECRTEIEQNYALESARIFLCEGGAERWTSVQNGVNTLVDIDFALVHDVARPLVSKSIIDNCIVMLKEKQACLVAKPVVDTVKKIQQNLVVETLDRRDIYLAQTPQCFAVKDLQKVYTQMTAHPEFVPTDEASMMEFFGYEVPICVGDELNDKVTTPLDLVRLELLYDYYESLA